MLPALSVDFAKAENASASMSRQLRGPSAEWGHLVANGQYVISAFANSALSRDADHRVLYEEVAAAPLIAAARVLDSAGTSISDDSIDDASRGRLWLLAALAYAMCGNFPSAQAAYQRAASSGVPFTPAMTLAAAVAVPKRLAAQLESLADSPKLANVAEALHGFHLGNGEYSRTRIRQLFDSALKLQDDTFDVVVLRAARLALRHALTLSTSRVLSGYKDALPTGYLARLVNAGVTTLLPPQYSVVHKAGLLDSVDNSLLALPTSTGKTLLGEFCITKALGQAPGLAIFIAPYVAIGTQAKAALTSHLPADCRVHGLFGGFQTEYDLDPQTRQEVVVATPERVDGLLRGDSSLLEHLRCIVVDEAHLVENRSRGLKLESMLSRLRLAQDRGAAFRMVFLSAVLSNYNALTDWLDISPANLHTSSWRPTARRLAFWSQDGSLKWIFGSDPFKPAGAADTSVLGLRTIPWPDADFRPARHVGAVRQQRPKINTNVSYLAEMAYRDFGGTVLCVCATKADSRSLAKALASRFAELVPPPPNLQRAVDIVAASPSHLAWLGPLLTRGVAFHNAALPQELRAAIEQAIAAREMMAIAATTTLAEGVDLPFRTTILVDWLVGFGDDQQPMSPLMFRNIAGRCGRAGVFTEGDTIIYDNPLGDAGFTPAQRWNRIKQSILGTPQPLQSSLRLTTTAFPQAEIEAILGSHLMAAIPENPTEDHLERVLAGSLLAAREPTLKLKAVAVLKRLRHSLLDETQGAFARAASPMRLTPLGEAANLTGFSPSSCRALLAMMNAMPRSDDLAVVCAEVLQASGALPEQMYDNLRKVLTVPRSKFLVKPRDFQPLLASWITGVRRSQMFLALPYVRASSRADDPMLWSQGELPSESWEQEYDKFEEFLNQCVQMYLPWVLRACSRLSPFVPAGDWTTEFDWNAAAVAVELPPSVEDDANQG